MFVGYPGSPPGRALAVSGAKTAAATRVSFHPQEPVVRRTHFLFGVNHVEVYNNIKFPFTRFAGSALFLRQKTHVPPPPGGIVYLSCERQRQRFYGMRMVFFPLPILSFFRVFGSFDNINFILHYVI